MSHELLFSKVKLKINQFIDDLKSTDSLFSGMKFASMLMLIRYRTAELLSRSLSLISWKKRTKTPANSSRRKGLVDSLTMEVF
ncbi:Protein containing ALS2cr12 (ALS2CR12) signature [Caenorhabditis elegans]|uniref:Protein containing ALS2cr12 (ALS2CR12) signature n=1 Tax=Caenorhabditis elegans TaxID=6239 RepID=Q8MNX2_CAEEL|nr:Protein containing ALS2cr12 (ALS2CR12) signature [Caenorhabditis elegans]CCD66062.1 Protein containing ALS2cr12 (ALS2CR12) signature [Caenorhabditis elegans]|eukprot:NP_741064.1 Protein containing ALS2cr12 (ALS2CR12) signature [Caenorhabditis elegans]